MFVFLAELLAGNMWVLGALSGNLVDALVEESSAGYSGTLLVGFVLTNSGN